MSTSEGAFSKKYIKTNVKSMFFWFSGVEVGCKNQLKIDQKIDSKMKCILASIFDRFWSILGAKLGEEIDQKSIKKGIEKTTPKTTRTRWPKNANKAPRRFSAPPIWSPGEGVGGEVKSPDRTLQCAKPIPTRPPITYETHLVTTWAPTCGENMCIPISPRSRLKHQTKSGIVLQGPTFGQPSFVGT